MTGTPQGPSDEYKARKAERERQQQEHAPRPWYWFGQREPVARFTLYLGIFTLCLVAVGILQFCGIRGQQIIMQGQLNEMQAEQRPWISVKITGPASLLQNVDGTLQLHVNYHLENVGKLPATRVFFFATIVPETDVAAFRDAINAACAHYISVSMETPNSTGFTLFPNQTADTAFGIDDAPITNFTTLSTTKQVAAFVPVCTIYRFKGDGGIFHYTPAAYILVTPTSSGPVNVDIVHMPVGGVAVEIRPLAQGNLDPT